VPYMLWDTATVSEMGPMIAINGSEPPKATRV
jgi:hypothetical protein